ncbi:MAG: hypothetical protein WA208_02730, partial [Thermoanaerobaculia bacterium]
RDTARAAVALEAMRADASRVAAAPRWEYRIETPADVIFDEEMKRLGAEGWDLVTARRATSSYGAPSYEIIFRRPVR